MPRSAASSGSAGLGRSGVARLDSPRRRSRPATPMRFVPLNKWNLREHIVDIVDRSEIIPMRLRRILFIALEIVVAGGAALIAAEIALAVGLEDWSSMTAIVAFAIVYFWNTSCDVLHA